MLGLGLTKFAPEFVYVFCIAVFFLTIFYKPQVGLYLVTFLLPLQNLRDKLIPFTLGQNMMDILIIGIVISLFVHAKKNTNSVPIDRSMVFPSLLLIVGTYSSLWVGYMKLGLPMPISMDSAQLVEWKNFIELPFLYFITLSTVRDKKQVMTIIWIMMITLLLMDFYFYDNSRFLDYTHFSEDVRSKGGSTFSYLGPNEIASFLAEITVFLLAVFLAKKWHLAKLAILGLIIFNSYCILYYFSRGAYLAMLGGLVFLGLTKDWKLLALILLLFVSWQVVLPTSVVERIEMTESDSGLDHSSESRIAMWTKAFDSVKSNPITGIGFGATRYLGIKNDSTGHGVRNSVHNGYLTVLVEQGIAGLLIMFYIFYMAARKGWALFKGSKDRELRGIGLGLVTMTIASLINNLTGSKWFFFDVMGYFWIIFALSMRAYEMSLVEKAAPAEAAAVGQLSQYRV